MQLLESKTIFGLIFLVLVTAIFALIGKLTPEVVDIIKWIGSSFFIVRTAANITENVSNKPRE